MMKVYIHLGSDRMVATGKIVAIVNIEERITEPIREIIEIASAEGNLVEIGSYAQAKSLVITNKEVYLSPISSRTLVRRSLKYCREDEQ